MRKHVIRTLTAALAMTVAVSATASYERKGDSKYSPERQLTTPVQSRTKIDREISEMLPKDKPVSVCNLTRQLNAAPAAAKPAQLPAKVLREAGVGTFYGAVVYSDAWGTMPDFCVASFPTTGGAYTRVADMQGTTTSWYADGKYYGYAVQAAWGFYYGTAVDVYDAATWELQSSTEVDVPYRKVLDMKQNPADGLVYGTVVEGSNIMWGTIDVNSFDFTPIAENLSWSAFGLVIKDGKGYGITPKGNIMEITLATGESTVVAQTQLPTKYLSSAYYDEASGKMLYMTNSDTSTDLYSIDLTSGEATKLHTYPDCELFTGFFSPRTMAEGTPAPVSDLTISLNGSLLDYAVTFTAPTVDIAGNALEGELTYKVTTGGQVQSGTVAPGAAVSVSASALVPSLCSARAVVSNAAGESNGVNVQAYVGPDDISAVGNVTLTDDGAGTFTLSWNSPKPVHNGYFDATQLSYVITDKAGNTIAENVADTTYTIPYTEPAGIESFQYSVAATYMGVTYEAVASNSITKGSLEPPFSCSFDSADDMNQFTIIDANGDGETWLYDSNKGMAVINFNSNMDMDDWMILPGLKLFAGKAYTFSVDAANADEAYAERFEVKMGTAATAAAMTIQVIEPVKVTSRDFVTHTVTFSVPADGVYYIGVHGCSDFDLYKLYIDNISVSAALAGDVPAPATNLTATPGAVGALTATISFTAPSTNLGGQPVGDLTKAVVTRGDGKVVGTVDAPVAGQTYTVEDTQALAGQNTYSVVVSNDKGDSEAATVEVFVGYGIPKQVTAVSVEETVEGMVTLVWNAVTEDVNGLALPAGSVTYAVYVLTPNGPVKIADKLTDTEFTYTGTQPGQQAMVQHLVRAVNEAGEGEGALSDLICVGTPYKTPFKESFANKSLAHIWSLSNPNPDGPMEVIPADDTTIQGVVSQDGDNGYLIFKGQYADDAATMTSGKIDIPAEGHTFLTFYTLGMSNEGGNDVYAEVICDGERTVLGTTVPLADLEWVRVSYDLTAYAGKTVRVAVGCKVTRYAYVMFDNISVETPLNKDLALVAFSAPGRVNAGEGIKLNATVENRGAQAADAYSVDFYMNGQLLHTVSGQGLEACGKTVVCDSLTTSPLTADTLEFYAVVNLEGDEDAASNTSKSARTEVVKTSMPVPTGLNATVADGAVNLSWDASNAVDYVGAYMTENFESALAGTSIVDGWTMVDMDKGPAGSINTKVVPGLPKGEPASFVVFEKAGEFTSATFNAFSGTQYIISMYNLDGSASSDWAISPVLSGNAQTVSFWARAYSIRYNELVRVHYTTAESVDPADYVMVEEFGTKTLNNEWTHLSFQVPAGATHFAIECCSTDGYFLMVDDVTFEIGGNKVELQGYNVYNNGVKLNDALVSTNAYTHQLDADGEQVYNVTAVYDKGESRPSDEARIMFNGLDNLGAVLNVVVMHDEIVVTGAAGADVAVYAADGKQVAARSNVTSTRIKVLPGVYVVAVGPRTVKVAVK